MAKNSHRARNKSNSTWIFVLFLCLILLGAGFYAWSSGLLNNFIKSPHATPTANPTKVENPYPAGFQTPEPGRRPVAVMIDNEGSRPLPQGGLYKAQIIYEALAEGGITRFMPIFFTSGPKKIGPVRSARDYFVDFAMEYDAIYTHIGWSPQAKQKIAKYGVNDINGLYDNIFKKITNNRYNWQDKYTSYDKIINYAQKKGYSLTTNKTFEYAYNNEMIASTDTQAKNADKEVYISYNGQHRVRYVYNSKTKLYKRFRNGAKHIERNTGKQLTAGNIIVQFVRNSTIINDKKNRQELYNVGSGTGWYITCGKAVKITWSKGSEKDPTIFKYLNGEKITLNPAQTWIQVSPLETILRIKGYS